MGRGGRKTYRDDPERRCIVSGETHPKRGLIRFVVSPEGEVVPDVLGRLPGRGLWVSAERAQLETAVAKKLFSRAARAQVSVPGDLIASVEAALLRRTVDLLSMARKAGQAVTGFEKVKDWLVKDQAAILLQAADGSERGKSKLRPPGGRGSFFDVLTASELGLAFGREHVIHAALAPGGLADKFREDAVRLSGVREDGGGGPATGKVKKTI
jgi:predicted RNA-binding protein YlxR (DUF448 family)